MTIKFNPEYYTPIQQIVDLESRARHAANGERIEDKRAIFQIRQIIRESGDKTTAIYGLRALSRLGVEVPDLLGIAMDFNGDLQPTRLYDRTRVTSVIVENSNGFKEIDLDGRILREVNYQNSA